MSNAGNDAEKVWKLWDDGFPSESIARRVISMRQREGTEYEIRAVKSTFHQDGSWAIEGCKTNKKSQTPFTSNQGVIVDADGAPIEFYHGTTGAFEYFDPSKTTDGGLHFGTKEQARMRVVGSDARLIVAHLRVSNPMRSKDLGGNWKAKIRQAKAAGKDGIVYLNRYEGMSSELIDRLQQNGLLDNLDGMSDAQFRKVVPEAQDSYIVFRADQVVHVNTEVIARRPRMRL